MSTNAPSPNFRARVTSLTALLWLFVVVTQLVNGLYFAREIEPPASYTLLYPLAFLWIIGLWMRRDSRKHGVGWTLDMGLFLYIAWPFIMPYYLFKTRGLQGLLLVGAFMGVYVLALIVGMALSMLPTS